MAPELEATLDALLLEVERTEMRSLRWGSTGTSLPQPEMIELARPHSSGDPEVLIKALLDRRLLFRVPAPGGASGYRSRFAEGIRLLASLRQIFPGGRWQAAPNLVADFRADLRERRFPRRDLPAEDVIERLAGADTWTARDRSIATALLNPDEAPLSLAAFQERAAAAVLRPSARDHGIVISAGTGSGKTLAYYLPALLRITREVRADEYWTKALSVYPRNELLKDQFSEVLRYVSLIGDRAGRPLRIGAFFGPTPRVSRVRELERSDWEPFPSRGAATAYVCPFATCPRCDSRLIWRISDIREGTERLVCEDAATGATDCEFETPPDQVLLTRGSVQRKPPDLLFTTAESLNQRMSDSWTRTALGLGQPEGRRPFLMLLDEVHTYEGVAGAQAAMVFRRWRHGVGAPVRWVGLSATLLGAPAFFAQLTGLLETNVEEIAPADSEAEVRAASYQLILRGDPVSRTSLLSTSIQTSLLLARLLDPETSGLAQGRAGHRAFVFTDDLDVTNRLYSDLRDAEYQLLARERSTERATSTGAFAAGQDWRVLEQIGWNLDQGLDVSRTTSQDSGVSAGSQLVVATASLEVGFDDDRVGAVVQHKSPYRSSSFVQRRGRAGRTRRMRPWMVTVLSDYGRDRLTYQSYERLFDPVIEGQRLPIANHYVRRIQAGFAFIDWLAAERPTLRGWWWWAVNGPTDNADTRRQQSELQAILAELLDGDADRTASLRGHLRQALVLSEQDLDAIFWQPPRSLMFELLPTLRSRLLTRWELAKPRSQHDHLDLVSGNPYPQPLPEFLPPNLFTDLNLPEVQISGEGVERGSSLLIEQALRQLAPGRVTRRFAPGRAPTYHWVPVPTEGEGTYRLPVDQFAATVRPVARVTTEVKGTATEVTIYRPWSISLEVAPVARGFGRPGTILASSNASMRWRSLLQPHGDPLHVEPAHDPVWSHLIERIEFYLHDQRSPLTVRRFALEAEATLQLGQQSGAPSTGGERAVRTQFREPSDPARPAAVGYEAEVDAMAVRFQTRDRARLADRAEELPALREWRMAYVRQLADTDPELAANTNAFQRDWLLHIYGAAVVLLAHERGIHAQDANQLIRTEALSPHVERLMDGVFTVEHRPEHPEDGADEADDATATDARTPRLRARLAALLADEQIRHRLGEVFDELWEPRRESWLRWLDGALHETLSEAARAAALSIAPDHAGEDAVRLDLDRRYPLADADRSEAWITESAIGGAGVIEAIANGYAQDPRAFFRAIEFTLLAGEFELSSVDLDATVRLAGERDEIRSSLADAARAQGPVERDAALHQLSSLLRAHGVSPSHAFLASLNQRLLRPGMPEAHALLNSLVSFWNELERTHGIALDLRAFSAIVVHARQIGSSLTSDALRTFIDEQAGERLTTAERVGALNGLLWPRPHEIRRHALASWSPFREAGFTDPALVRLLVLRDRVPEIRLTDPAWEIRLQTALSRSGVARLSTAADDVAALKTALLQCLAAPIDVGFLQLFPTVEQIRRQGPDYVATLVLRGVV